jgi:hypothetical protein
MSVPGFSGASPPAYNPGMRACFFIIALLPLACLAQATIEREGTPDPRKNQKIERIHVEDGGNTIDELRVGGQTEAITVQPKAKVPAYEIQTDDLAHSRPAEGRDGFAERKQRVWNVFGF